MSEDEPLPDDWVLKPVSEVATINPRLSLPDRSDYAYVPMDAVDPERHSITRFERREDMYSGLSKFEAGDILVARITPCFENGNIVRVEEIPERDDYAVGSSEFVVIRPVDIHPQYLFHYLNSPSVLAWGESKMSGAIGRERVKVSEFRNELTIPVPPIEEQERIVSVLDDAFASLDRVAELSKQVDDLADEFINTVSRLQFKQSSTPNEWNTCELGEAVKYKSNLTTPKETPDREFTLLDLEDVESHTGRITGTKQAKGSEIGSSKREFGTNDILYCKLRPYLNKVVCPEFEGVASSELLVLEPKDEFLKEYVAYYLRSPTVFRRAESLMKGANHPRINKTDLLSFSLPKPPLDEQERIVELLDAATGRAGGAAAKAAQSEDYADELRESLLHQAFTGDLLPE